MRAIIVIVCSLVTISSGISQTKNGFNLANATIPIDLIFAGGPPRDGIPALTNPAFIHWEEATYLDGNDRVIGLQINGEAKAYPIKIMDYHEVVNDELAKQPVVVTYCPLCGSGIVFEAVVSNNRLEFGVSGLLYNSDVLLFDRKTESLWSQLMTKAISGELKGEKLKIIPSENTTWADWLEKHPETTVLSLNTGYNRNYATGPYQGYDKSEQLYFPVTDKKGAFPNKERVLGIEIKGVYKAYPVSRLKQGTNQDEFKGVPLTITYDPKSENIIATSPTGPVTQMVVYWFAWFTFHPYTKIYKPD